MRGLAPETGTENLLRISLYYALTVYSDSPALLFFQLLTTSGARLINFSNQGTVTNNLYTFPIMRCPKGKLSNHRAEPRKSPDRIVFSVDESLGEVTFIRRMPHAGCQQRGFEINQVLVSATVLLAISDGVHQILLREEKPRIHQI